MQHRNEATVMARTDAQQVLNAALGAHHEIAIESDAATAQRSEGVCIHGRLRDARRVPPTPERCVRLTIAVVGEVWHEAV